MVRRFEATPVDLHLAASFRERRTYFVRAIDVSNPGPSSGESTNYRFLPDFIPLGCQAADAS
jgi:hypothetical protein